MQINVMYVCVSLLAVFAGEREETIDGNSMSMDFSRAQMRIKIFIEMPPEVCPNRHE